MITAKKVAKLIKTFERVLPYARHEKAFLMGEAGVSIDPKKVDKDELALNEWEEHHCGTTHCHAGWYLLAKRWDLKSKFLPGEPYGNLWCYEDGITEMENDLGCSVSYWAEKNAKIWGNPHGGKVFFSSQAFGDDCTTLDDVVGHWRGVHKRLLDKENKQNA